nr:MAG TPA: hypothetical protein [Caudoviricetes sp.]
MRKGGEVERPPLRWCKQLTSVSVAKNFCKFFKFSVYKLAYGV